MTNQTEDTAVVQKTRELCQTILDQPSMVLVRQRIDTFMGDDAARAQYQDLVAKGQALQEKQQHALPLSDEEVREFQSQREQLLQNPVACGFLDAQEQMRAVQHSVNKFLTMTLESGRVPTVEDVEAASCGHGCNCGH
ncbi:MAG: YlbF family regulator [Verrucomicrobia bacterium]|nr:YlbF family regulator [Verrucomicrobiota bacterium]